MDNTGKYVCTTLNFWPTKIGTQMLTRIIKTNLNLQNNVHETAGDVMYS